MSHISQVTQEYIDKYCIPLSDYKNEYLTSDEDTINNHWNEFLLAQQHPELDYEYVRIYLVDQAQNKWDYREKYQNTAHWKIIRNKRTLIDSKRCQFNFEHDNTKLNVHHKTYIYLGEEQHYMDCLITYCEPCHHELHEREKKEKKKQKLNPEYLDESMNFKLKRINGNGESEKPEEEIKKEEIPVFEGDDILEFVKEEQAKLNEEIKVIEAEIEKEIVIEETVQTPVNNLEKTIETLTLTEDMIMKKLKEVAKHF